MRPANVFLIMELSNSRAVGIIRRSEKCWMGIGKSVGGCMGKGSEV